jgi:hypothetical protein
MILNISKVNLIKINNFNNKKNLNLSLKIIILDNRIIFSLYLILFKYIKIFLRILLIIKLFIFLSFSIKLE